MERCLYAILTDDNGPDSDEVVAESSEENLTIGRPSERQALWSLGIGVCSFSNGFVGVDSKVINDGSARRSSVFGRMTCTETSLSLGLEVKDLDRGRGSGTEPVPVGREDQSVDNVTGFETVQVLAVVEIPEHGDSILSSGSGKRAIG